MVAREEASTHAGPRAPQSGRETWLDATGHKAAALESHDPGRISRRSCWAQLVVLTMVVGFEVKVAAPDKAAAAGSRHLWLMVQRPVDRPLPQLGTITEQPQQLRSRVQIASSPRPVLS